MTNPAQFLAPASVGEVKVLVTNLLEEALLTQVDDLLVEPGPEDYRVVQSHADAPKVLEVHRGSRGQYEAVRDLLKSLSGMRLDTHDSRQRGAFQFSSNAGMIGVQVLVDPGSKGEWVRLTVGRLLAREAVTDDALKAPVLSEATVPFETRPSDTLIASRHCGQPGDRE